MRRKIILLPSIVLILLFLGYFFFPLDSDRFKIRDDEVSTSNKLKYLEAKVTPIADSLKTNILWIVVDDLGMADTDLYTNGPVKVPEMNQLAKQGVLFTNAYISSPVCSPSRAAIATGRYNQRFGHEHQLHERYLKNRMEYYAFRYIINSNPWVPKYQTKVPNQEFMRNMGLPTSEISFAEVSRKYGYHTGYIGKWHLGKKLENSPNAFGFDYFYGFYASHSLYSPEGTAGIVDQKIPADFTDKYIWEGQRNDLQAIRVNDKIVEEDRYLTNAITDESIAFIDQNKNDPFYLWVAYNAPHTPLQAPKKYVEMYSSEPDPIKRVHYAMIKCLDDEIGRLMDHLDARGLADNTLVMLISDNGGAEYNLTTDNGRYQGGKITNFEGGVKVPMIMRWPTKIKANQVFDYPVHATDLFYTSASVLGAPLPGDRIYDGADLITHVNEHTIPHDYIYHEMGTNRGIRNMEWKLTWNEVNGDSVLFNLEADPFEQYDLYGNNKEVVEELTSAFSAWSANNVEPLWPGMIYYYYTSDDGKQYYFDE
jgi:arylsulfatase A-like enzyme